MGWSAEAITRAMAKTERVRVQVSEGEVINARVVKAYPFHLLCEYRQGKRLARESWNLADIATGKVELKGVKI